MHRVAPKLCTIPCTSQRPCAWRPAPLLWPGCSGGCAARRPARRRAHLGARRGLANVREQHAAVHRGNQPRDEEARVHGEHHERHDGRRAGHPPQPAPAHRPPFSLAAGQRTNDGPAVRLSAPLASKSGGGRRARGAHRENAAGMSHRPKPSCSASSVSTVPAQGARVVQSRATGDLKPDIVGSRASRSLDRVACTMMRATAGTCGCFFIAARAGRAAPPAAPTRAHPASGPRWRASAALAAGVRRRCAYGGWGGPLLWWLHGGLAAMCEKRVAARRLCPRRLPGRQSQTGRSPVVPARSRKVHQNDKAMMPGHRSKTRVKAVSRSINQYEHCVSLGTAHASPIRLPA